MKKLFLRLMVCVMIALSILAYIPHDVGEKRPVFAEQSLPQEQGNEDISIFIRQPTHSVFYNNKLYFIDESDKLLKVYDNSNDTFLSGYLDLSAYDVLDICFLEDSLYLMTNSGETNQIHKVNLASLEMTTIEDIVIQNTSEHKYKTFFAQKIIFDDNAYTLFTFSGFRLAPKLALIDNESGDVLNVFNITFNGDLSEEESIKTFSWQQTDGNAYIIFVYDAKIAYYPVSTLSAITSLESNAIQSWSQTNIPDVQSRSLENETIVDVGFANINSKHYLSIFYKPIENAGDFLRLYSFDFSNGIDTISFAAEFSCKNSEFATISGNYIAFPNKLEQKLHFNQIIENSEPGEQKLLMYSNVVNNPKYTVELFDFSKSKDEDLIYKTTNKLTKLFTDPWGATEDVTIDALTDVVKIGNVSLENGKKINDYVYCLYSFAGKNHCGFINASDLDDKQDILLGNAGYAPRLKVWPGTRLYSLPSNIASGQITSSTVLISKLIMEIDANFEVEVLDVICGYISNGTKMIKVRVNGEHIGYIEEKCIRKPSKVVEFVVTNATIQNDKTIVYHNADTNSTCLTFTLDKGKNVRINGKRNTKTGWTSITFNDEYGNEFTGYIQTDFIKADAWSTLQIVGCILIAVNIGLLILILMYKKNHLGNHCQKITEENINSNQDQ